MANENIYQSDFTGQQMDERFRAVATLAEALTVLEQAIAAKYTKPDGGIPSSDMNSAVQNALALALTSVQSLADYYTKSEVDAMVAAVNAQEYVDVTTLPTASASTMGKIYLVGPDGSGYYSYYYTSYDGSAYSWVGPLGTTEISMANYATKAELSQLDQETSALGVKAVSIGVQNGSQGNPANAWTVVIRGTEQGKPIPVTPGKTYKLTINKTPESGFNYYWRIITYSTTNPTSLNKDKVRDEVATWDNYHKNGDFVTINSGEAALSISLTELTSPGAAQAQGTCIALRDTDFSAGELSFVEGPFSDMPRLESEISKVYEDPNAHLFLHTIGQTGVEKKFNILSGHKYRFWFHSAWDVSSTTGNKFSISFALTPSGSYTDAVAYGHSTELPEYVDILAPSNYCRLWARGNSGEVVDIVIEDITSLDRVAGEGVVPRNKDRQIALEAICRYRKTTAQPQKDISLLIVSDTHNDNVAFQNAVDAANGFATIDALVHCGDIVGSYPTTGEIANFNTRYSKLSKPGYVCVGNHDVGNSYYLGICFNHGQVYNSFIKPMVDAGFLSQGEYENGKNYWYHDNATYKTRIICLYDYDDPLDVATNDYWEAVEYDSSAAEIARSTSYVVGNIVKCGNYTDSCFRCKANVTTPSTYYSEKEKWPHYTILRGSAIIRQAQAQWFLDTLASTPANYGVIVVKHQVFSDSAVSIDAKFSQSAGVLGASTTGNMLMETDFIGDALAAFMSGSNYSANVVMRGDASYLNTEGGGTYAYTVSKDFSVKNTGVDLLGVVSGHAHRDFVFKKGNIYDITVVCANTSIANSTTSDIRRRDDDGLTKDSLTVMSVATGRIGLAKIGVNVTENGKPRDFEVIPVTN